MKGENNDSQANNDQTVIDERFKDDPEAKYRIYSLLSYFVVMFFIGLPIWWHTTKVYRAPLPLDEMFNVEIPNKTIRQNSIPLSIEYDVLITVINPNPASLQIDLNTKDINVNLAPFLKTITAVAEFTTKSQWLYLVDLGIVPSNQGDHLAIKEEQLPHVFTPLEKKIWSHMSPRPSLNLILYVPHCKIPLYVYNKQNERAASNAFLSPGWGGILIQNADADSCKVGKYTPDLKPIINTFLIQLRELLGLKSDSDEDIAMLKKVKAVEMVQSTRRTLKSLAQLLSEINSIVISDAVGAKIELALKKANEADDFLKSNNVDEALMAAKVAFKSSEDAFSDPSLLALLYFPDDQKYAVYIPLFLPIMIPVMVSLITVRKCYMSTQCIKTKLD